MSKVGLRRRAVALAIYVLTPLPVAACPGVVESIWSDGVWETLSLEEEGAQRAITTAVTIESLGSGATAEVLENGVWTSAGVGTYTTSSVRVAYGTGNVSYIYDSCEEEYILGDE